MARIIVSKSRDEIIIDFDSVSESPWISRSFRSFSSIYMVFLIEILLRCPFSSTVLNFEIFLRQDSGQKFNFFRLRVRMPKSFFSSTANDCHQCNQQARKARSARPPPTSVTIETGHRDPKHLPHQTASNPIYSSSKVYLSIFLRKFVDSQRFL
jgi:hypothetical protein